MAFEIQFPDQGNIVEFRLSGQMDFDDFSRMHQGLYFAPQWRTGMNCLGILEDGLDISAITPDVLLRDFRAELERVKRLRGPEFKMAWVALSEHPLPILKLWETQPVVQKTYEMRIFRSVEDGREWLETFNTERNAA